MASGWAASRAAPVTQGRSIIPAVARGALFSAPLAPRRSSGRRVEDRLSGVQGSQSALGERAAQAEPGQHVDRDSLPCMNDPRVDLANQVLDVRQAADLVAVARQLLAPMRARAASSPRHSALMAALANADSRSQSWAEEPHVAARFVQASTVREISCASSGPPPELDDEHPPSTTTSATTTSHDEAPPLGAQAMPTIKRRYGSARRRTIVISLPRVGCARALTGWRCCRWCCWGPATTTGGGGTGAGAGDHSPVARPRTPA